MASPVGYLTQIATVAYKDWGTGQWKRTTQETVLWLHPTKGWRRSSRKKSTKVVSYRDQYPRTTFTEKWSARP